MRWCRMGVKDMESEINTEEKTLGNAITGRDRGEDAAREPGKPV